MDRQISMILKENFHIAKGYGDSATFDTLILEE